MSGAKALIFFSHEYVGREPDNDAFTRDAYVLEFALAVPTT
jgi:hypothetical protein